MKGRWGRISGKFTENKIEEYATCCADCHGELKKMGNTSYNFEQQVPFAMRLTYEEDLRQRRNKDESNKNIKEAAICRYSPLKFTWASRK